MDIQLWKLKEQIEQRWPDRTRCRLDTESSLYEITCDRSVLPELCEHLFLGWNFSFAGLIVEEVIVEKEPGEWRLRYIFYGELGLVHVLAAAPLTDKTFPSIAKVVYAADWHEREAEDLFGLIFEGHPRLGDFVLHNDRWCENLVPMRHYFDPSEPLANRRPDLNWKPQRIVEAPGAFAMPIGPKFSGVTESVQFLLETVGEDVIRAVPRLFYKYRAVEKMAEAHTVENVILLAERFAATTAFAHALAFCRAIESISATRAPSRARALRVLFAELERLRHHAGAIQEICESTALVVANNQAAILEEELLRLSGAFTGHRYLFGLAVPGGLSRDFDDAASRDMVKQAQSVLKRLDKLEKMLRTSSSFLDRLEEVGIVSQQDARGYGLVGPVARASGVSRDVRKALPYSGYEAFTFDVPSEQEGDGYARLRVFFAEARQSVKLMEQAVAALRVGPVLAELKIKPGAALGWVEAPRGATFHWMRIDDNGKVARYHLLTPSFANWHGFHLAAEQFAFQDFPIILATFDLSVAENDR